MKNKILTVLILMGSVFNVYSQRTINDEEYSQILTTDMYYFGRSDAGLENEQAKSQARENFLEQINEFEKSISGNELLQRANYVMYKRYDNKTIMIFYIAKDALYVERIVETKTIDTDNKTEPVKSKEILKAPAVETPKKVEPEKEPEPALPIEPAKTVAPTEPKPAKIETGNEIINALSQISDFNRFCVQLNIYKRQGKLFDSQSGMPPDALENCVMAIFENNVLEALYDKGGSSRNDFLTGKTVQKPEEYYKNKHGIKVIFIKINQ